MKNFAVRLRRLEGRVQAVRACAVCGSAPRLKGEPFTLVVEPPAVLAAVGESAERVARCRGCGRVNGLEVYEIPAPVSAVAAL